MNKDLDGSQEKMGAIPEGFLYRAWTTHSRFQSVKDIAGFYISLTIPYQT
jgi:hypothetical protein